MRDGSQRPSRNHGLILIGILALSVLLRVGVALYLGDVVDAPPLLTDQRAYNRLAVRLVEGHGFSFAEGNYPFTLPETPTAHWSFLQSLFVAGVYETFGVHPLAARLAEAVLGGLLLPWVVYRLARRLLPASDPQNGESRKEVLPLLAAALAAVYFYFVLYAATLMTETLYIVAVLWSMERAMALREILRRGAAQGDGGAGEKGRRGGAEEGSRPSGDARIVALELGLGLGIATLLRQSILPWVVILFAWLLWVNVRTVQSPNPGWSGAAEPGIQTFQPRSDRRSLDWRSNVQTLAALAVTGLMLLACILPFTIRNYRVYGSFLLLNSNAGYAMYSSQHPMHGTNFQEFEAAPLPADLQGTNEAEWDRDLMRRGISFVMAEPGRYLLLSLSRIPDYFEFWPTRDTTLLNNVGRVGSFGLFLPFMLYGIFLAVRQARWGGVGWGNLAASPLGLALLFMLCYSLSHIFTWAMPRYRLPVDAVALPFAALAIVDLAGRLVTRRRRTPAGEQGML